MNPPLSSIRQLPAVLALMLGSALASSAQAVTYLATDIGSLAVGDCSVNEMNARGQVVGGCLGENGYTAFATWRNGRSIHRVGVIGGSFSWTNGLNDDGVLVGDASMAGDLASHAWVKYPRGEMTDLGTLGGRDSVAMNINNKGLIVGMSMIDTASFAYHGFVIQPGTTTMIDVGSLGGTGMVPWDVNNRDIIVGQGALPGDIETRGFYTKPPYDRLITLDSLGGSFAAVYAINDHGAMVGTARTASGLSRGFVAQVGNKALTELATPAGRPAAAFNINNLGQIVGQFARASDDRTLAFLCTGHCTDLVDLNTATTGLPVGVELRSANDINDKGQIATTGSDGHIYLLTPQ